MEENIIIDEEFTTPVDEVVTETVEPVPELVPDLEQQEQEQTENELLIEYIKLELLKNAENEEVDELEQIENVEMQTREVQQVQTDYSSQLSSIVGELESISVYMENYYLDNTIDSSVEDITLTNSLLLVTIICILFTATINFARRIF